MTGGQVKHKRYLKRIFSLTYGDGLANVNIDELLDFQKIIKMLTFTTVRPIARFGELNINNKSISSLRKTTNIVTG